MFKNRYKYISRTLNNKARDVSLDGLKRLILLKTSESETGAKNQKSKDEERVGKTSRQGL
jgi:hypothetical protein